MSDHPMNAPVVYMGRLKPIRELPSGFYDVTESDRYVIATNQPRDDVALAIQQFLLQRGLPVQNLSRKTIELNIRVKKTKENGA